MGIDDPHAASVGPPGWAPPQPRLATPAPPSVPAFGIPQPNPDAVLGPRFAAWFVDGLLLSGLFAAGGAVAGMVSPDRSAAVLADGGFGLNTAVFVAVWLAYFLVCESYGGQTIGKRLGRVRVVRLADGGRPAPGAIVTRTLLRLVEGLWLLSFVGYLAIRTSPGRRQRLGDRAAGTTVVRAHGPAREFSGLVLTGAALGVPLLLALAVLSPVWPALSVRSDSERIADTASRFLVALAAGDAASACALSSRAQQHDEVVGASRRPGASAPLTCVAAAQFPAAQRRMAARLRTGPLQVRLMPSGNLAIVTSGGRGVVPLVSEDGAWKVDYLGPTRYVFVRGCTAGGALPRQCGCAFDQLRARGVTTDAEFARLQRRFAAGEAPPGVRETLAACR
jgi:uncharacterized RDD family membrane protein YckC